MRYSPLILVTVGAALACSGAGRTEYEDKGVVCLRADANGSLSAEVSWSCISSSDEVLSKTCSIERTDDGLQIQSRAVVETPDGPSNDDCGIASTTCEIPALEPGEYVIRHGADEDTVPVAVGLTRFLVEPRFEGMARCE